MIFYFNCIDKLPVYIVVNIMKQNKIYDSTSYRTPPRKFVGRI